MSGVTGEKPRDWIESKQRGPTVGNNLMSGASLSTYEKAIEFKNGDKKI